ncbi:MAG TPA: DUF721 domain-containing protein [Pyrinomonadaceae bacterium]
MLDLFRTLPGLLKEIEGSEELRTAMIFAAWRRIAGGGLAEHAVPVRLEGSTLVVAVANLMWQRQLKDLAGQMLFKLNGAVSAPVVSFIEFEIDEARVREASQTGVDADEFRREAEGAISPDLVEAAASIDDEELRKQFLMAAGSCIVRRGRVGSR